MQITHLGHSTVLVEVGGRRILIDPGAFSSDWHDVTDLDAVVVTHLHPDHVDPEHAPALVAANAGAMVRVEPGVLDTVGLERAEGLRTDEVIDLGGGVEITAIGGSHAVIHQDIPMIGNLGLVISAEGEPRFFHPGDSLTAIPDGIDVLAVPAYGPWAAMKETVDFARAVRAPQGFLIHDGLLAERGYQMIKGRVEAMSPTAVAEIRGGTAHSF